MLNVIIGLLSSAGGRGLVSRGASARDEAVSGGAPGHRADVPEHRLFEGMSVLDNIMTGRLTHMKSSLFAQALW